MTIFNANSTTNEVIAGIALDGRVAVVTGASAGLGIETARVLAQAGATVLLVARDREKLAPVLQSLREQLPGARLESALMDLADLDSVRAAAADIARALSADSPAGQQCRGDGLSAGANCPGL